MNISATGSSSLTALYLQQLLGNTTTSALLDDTSSSSSTSATDLLSISAAGQRASATKGSDPFRTDLAQLDSSIATGDLATARKEYQAMADKMKEHGELPRDFAAIGKALDAGDLTAAGAAMDKVKTHMGKHKGGGSSPLQDEMDQLSALIQAGDTSGASSLFSTLLNSTQGTTSGSDAFTSATSSLTAALASGDTSSSSQALDQLLATLQKQGGANSASYAKTLEAMASEAYQANAGLLNG